MLLFDVENQVITRRDRFSPATDSVKYLKAKFNFKTDDWSDKSKTAVFTVFDKKYPAVLDSNNVCTVPWEALAYNVENNYQFAVDNYIHVSVVGIKGDIRITTDKVKILLNLSGYGEWENTSEPTPDVYTQYVNIIKDSVDEVYSVLDDTKEVKNETEAINEEIKNSYSNAIKGEASGEVVRVDDVSPVEHTVKVKVKSNNLIPYPYSDTNSETIIKVSNGITFTDNGDGSITANGTATANAVFYFINYADKFYINGDVCLSGCPEGGSFTGTGYSLRLNKYVDGVEQSGIVDIGNSRSDSFKNEQIRLYFVILTGTTVNNLTVKPKLEYGDVATEYTPYIDPTTVTVTRYGADESDNPINYTPNEDGSVDGVKSVSPTMTLLTDNANATIELEYNRDINVVLDYALSKSSRIAYVTLLSSNWNGEGNLYSQVVTIDGTTKNTQVDLTPSVEQLAVFYNKNLAFVTENENGVITVYAIGQKPQNDYTIQVTLTEVKR